MLLRSLRPSPILPALLSAVALAASLLSGGAAAAEFGLPVGDMPAAGAQVLPQDGAGVEPAAGTRSMLVELQARMREGRVRELRTRYDGDYGTSLLVADDAVVCYVALLHQRSLWRVFRFDAFADAERAFTRLSQQNADWAKDAIVGTVLNSQQRELSRLTQESEARLGLLDAELMRMQAQRRLMLEAQQSAQAQANAAHVENRAARLQLDQLYTRIRELEASLLDGVADPPAKAGRRAGDRR